MKTNTDRSHCYVKLWELLPILILLTSCSAPSPLPSQAPFAPFAPFEFHGANDSSFFSSVMPMAIISDNAGLRGTRLQGPDWPDAMPTQANRCAGRGEKHAANMNQSLDSYPELMSFVSLAKDLWPAPGSEAWLATFKIKLALNGTLTQRSAVRGRLLLWSTHTPQGTQGWFPLALGSSASSQRAGQAFVLKDSVSVARITDLNEVTGPSWHDLIPAIKRARFQGSHDSLILFENLDTAAPPADKFRVAAALKKSQELCQVPFAESGIDTATARLSTLPAGQIPALLPAGNTPQGQQGSPVQHISKSLTLPQGSLAYSLTSHITLGLQQGSWHATLDSLVLSPNFAAPTAYEIQTYKVTASQPASISGPVVVARGKLATGQVSLSMAGTTPAVPVDWSLPANPTHWLFVVIKFQNQAVVLGVYAQGNKSVPTKGITFPF